MGKSVTITLKQLHEQLLEKGFCPTPDAPPPPLDIVYYIFDTEDVRFICDKCKAETIVHSEIQLTEQYHLCPPCQAQNILDNS